MRIKNEAHIHVPQVLKFVSFHSNDEFWQVMEKLFAGYINERLDMYLAMLQEL